MCLYNTEDIVLGRSLIQVTTNHSEVKVVVERYNHAVCILCQVVWV